MQDNLRARVIAGTAIFRGDRILLLHRSLDASSPGIWDLPGGHVELRESLSRAAKRETLEETGFEVRLGPLYHAAMFSSLSKGGKARRSVGVYFHCSAPAKKTPRLDPEEHSAYAWVAASDLVDYPTIPHISRAIRLAFSTRTSVRAARPSNGKSSLGEGLALTFPVPA